MNNSFVTGNIRIADLLIPRVSSGLRPVDFWGAVMVRWGFNRSNYRVDPGMYAVGNPASDSDVFVTANYKLTFDNLRKNLSGTDAWILVLDTKGVNVWCAAGKGTFGTRELVNRIKSVSLNRIVNHRRLIVPQLGATGVAAHKVKDETGFNVHYGPVRASDIKKFILQGYRADREMRKVKFGFSDRVKLIPNDFMYWKFYLLGAASILFLVSGLTSKGLTYRDFAGAGGPALLKVLLAYLSGVVVTPMFLPYIPGRHFSLKGIFAGAVFFLGVLLFGPEKNNPVETVSWFFVMTSISSFLAMNFTGSSTFTSLSGVKKEMKIFLPLQIGFAVIGIILQVTSKLI